MTILLNDYAFVRVKIIDLCVALNPKRQLLLNIPITIQNAGFRVLEGWVVNDFMPRSIIKK